MIQRNNGIHISAVNKGKEQQSMLYLPFELVVSCREMPKDIHSNLPLGPIMPNGTYGILFISATPISSIYCGECGQNVLHARDECNVAICYKVMQTVQFRFSSARRSVTESLRKV